MPKQSAGLVVHRKRNGGVDVLLVHPGGPFWKNKDAGAWSIPKGEFSEGEDPFEVAQREFREETGLSIDGTFTPLRPIKQRGGKMVYAWAIEADIEASQVKSNTFTIEWPAARGNSKSSPRSTVPSGFQSTPQWKRSTRASASYLSSFLPEEIVSKLGARSASKGKTQFQRCLRGGLQTAFIQ